MRSNSIQARIHHSVYFDFHHHNCPYTYPPLFSFFHINYNIKKPPGQATPAVIKRRFTA